MSDENDRIEIGDVVDVTFTSAVSVRGVILRAPRASGDSWIIRQTAGTIVYVQMFERMDLLRPRNK